MNITLLRGTRSVVALWLGLAAATVEAEPLFHLPNQPVSGRMSPAPFDVEAYHGTLNWGYDRVSFTAPGGVLRWNAWIDAEYLTIAKQALQVVEQRAVGNARCNRYFREQMPRAKSFDQIWHGKGPERIRISFSPGPAGIWRTATYGESAPYEWTITETTVRMGVESVASALVHEATRTNGIGAEARIAYQAESACGIRHFLLTPQLVSQFGWRSERTMQ